MKKESDVINLPRQALCCLICAGWGWLQTQCLISIEICIPK